MFEAAVDGFGGAIAGVGVVEVGQVVPGSAFERSSQSDEFGQTARCSRVGQCVDFCLHQSPAPSLVGLSAGIDDALVDALGNLECNLLLTGEQVEYLVLLARRELA